MSQTSDVLIVGPPPARRLDFGADTVKNFKEAILYLEKRKPAVAVFGSPHGGGFDEFCEHVLANSPETLWILSCEGLSPSQLIHLNNHGRLFDLIDGFDDPELETKLKGALEASGESQQRRQLVGLFEGQSQQLKRLKNELEARVDRRHKTLRKSLKTLDETKSRLETFHKALLGIHRASSIVQMEQTLNEILGESFNLDWIRVRFANQSLLAQQKGPNILSIEIPFGLEGTKGQVLYAKPEGKRFNPGEADFFHELTDALALALSRLSTLEQAETLKAQWQATFDSIPHPLCLTTTNEFEILKLNRAFQQACTQQSFRSLIGKNCFQVFFGNEFQPPSKLESPFTFRNARTGVHETEQFEIVGERLGLTYDNQPVQLILLRPVTDEVRFERRIVAATKLAELGTIGSSIAHELNNPLGGMLSFLQLILMDIKSSDPLYSDIKGMEQAVLRCRDIILNLLSFARKQDLGDFTEVDLWDVLLRAIKLIELQSKSKGIQIEIHRGKPAKLRASSNALSQAICNILQNSIDAIGDRLKLDPLFPGKVSMLLDVSENRHVLKIIDNGSGIRPENQSQIFNPLFTTRDPSLYSGMGLTTAFTIIGEHGGTLEILSQTGSGTTAIVALPN